VPSMGVAGRFYVDGTMAGSMENVLRVVDQLVAQVRKA
ncbi:MAG: thiol:disulfide interchange protein DsbA/DsbL, partial [Proteobacteria bacterium]|nr:thiol:disulfide interchange protein DsbA/DsbL [Pseudomonadota bacterium]